MPILTDTAGHTKASLPFDYPVMEQGGVKVLTPSRIRHGSILWTNSYEAFHTRSDMSGVKGIIGMHRFNICLVVVLSLSCSGVKTP